MWTDPSQFKGSPCPGMTGGYEHTNYIVDNFIEDIRWIVRIRCLFEDKLSIISEQPGGLKRCEFSVD